MRKLFIFLLCLGWLIFLKPEAQIGIFEDKPMIYIPKTGDWYVSKKINGIIFTDKETDTKIRLPWSSVAYVVIEDE